MGNPYFKTSYDPTNNEAELYRKATDEVCEMHGVDMIYLPRTRVKDDDLFGEDVLQKFESNKTVTFYIENYADFDGVGDIFSKFGFQPDDQLILVVEKENFDAILDQEPLVSDLLYYPAADTLYEIVHVDPDRGTFFQFNFKQYCYKITCKSFEYSYEDMDTGVDDIDDIDQELQNTTDESDLVDSEKDDYLNLDVEDIFGNI